MSVTRRLSPITPEIRLFGDWQKTRRVLATLDTTVALGVLSGQKSAALKLKRLIKKNIRENGGSLGWEPVSQKYAKYKSSKGYDPSNLLVMSGLYYRNINIWHKNGKYYVGVKKGITNKVSGGNLTVGKIARILEYGSTIRNIKARPLWIPTFKQFGGKKRLQGIMIWHIRNQILKNYGLRAKITL